MRKIITIIIAAVGAAAAVTGAVFAIRAAVIRKKAAENEDCKTEDVTAEAL